MAAPSRHQLGPAAAVLTSAFAGFAAALLVDARPGVVWLWVATGAAAYFARPRPWQRARPALFMVVVFAAIWWVIAPSAQLAKQSFPFNIAIDHDEFASTSGIIALFLTSLLLAYGASQHYVPSHRHTEQQASDNLRSCPRFVQIVLSVGCVAYLAQSATLFGYRTEVFGRVYSDGGTATASVLRTVLVVTPGLIGLLALGRVVERRKQRRSRLGFASNADYFLIILGAAATNPVANARFLSGSFMIAAALIICRSWRPTSRGWSLGIFAAFLLIFPSADAFRQGPGTSVVSAVDFTTVDYDTFALISASSEFDRRQLPGNQLLSAGLVAIPRSIWPGKAPSTGPLIQDQLGLPSHYALAGSGIAAAYMDYELPGVVLFGLLAGIAVATFDVRLRRYATQSEQLAMTAVLVGLLPYTLRGGLDSGIANMLAVIGVGWALSRVGSIAKHHRARRAGRNDFRASSTTEARRRPHAGLVR